MTFSGAYLIFMVYVRGNFGKSKFRNSDLSCRKLISRAILSSKIKKPKMRAVLFLLALATFGEALRYELKQTKPNEKNKSCQ